MARPTKQGIDYFPIDCQFDDKIEMLLIEKGGNGLSVLITLWQMIYSNEGYFIANNKDLHLLIKRKIDVDINEVSDCINVCLDRNIFNSKIHSKFKVLTSKAIQKRYFDAAKKKKSVTICKDFIINGIDSCGNWVNDCGNATNVNIDVDVKEDVNVKVEVKEDISVVFTHWQTVMNHHKSILDDKRKKLITKQLKAGYTVSDLMSAISGCSNTPHNMGDNERGTRYDGLDLILRDSDHIERFMKNDVSPPSPQNSADKRFQSNVHAANQAMAELEGGQ